MPSSNSLPTPSLHDSEHRLTVAMCKSILGQQTALKQAEKKQKERLHEKREEIKQNEEMLVAMTDRIEKLQQLKALIERKLVDLKKEEAEAMEECVAINTVAIFAAELAKDVLKQEEGTVAGATEA